ncbi:hypothetical protein E4T48_06629 [Aureobasidium sp. EXF-10727]|nr:hypothetical protein E4T48_06629 [Aureobasidium sp. EXF-10727]
MPKKHKNQTSKLHPLPINPNKEPTTQPTNQANQTTQPTPSTPPIFFFKPEEQPYGFLCQWYRCHFTDPTSNLEFSSAEQWMMYNKAHLSNDIDTATAIMATTSPRKQKQLGRDVKNFDAEAWERIKLSIVEKGNYLKFSQGNNLASMKIIDDEEVVGLGGLLLATEDRELVEASRFDRIWGIEFDAQQALTTPRDNWGQNLLGTALMNVRERIRKDVESL